MLNTIPKLVGIDLETTGSSFSDRIVEIALITFTYGELKDRFVQRINPGIPIPKSASAIHGITDDDVRDKPGFGEIADLVSQTFREAVIFGYNVIFDFNVLSAEMVRAGRNYMDPKKWVLLDPFVIWKKHDPKTLECAYRSFCGKKLEGAHGALSDISATHEVLEAQLKVFGDLPGSYRELGLYCYPGDPSWVCSSYHFVWNEKGEIVCNFGKNKGIKLKKLVVEQKFFCDWIVDKEFPEDVKELVKNALSGKELPLRPKLD